MADVGEDVKVLPASLALADALQDRQHPAGALPAWRALAARFMREEPRDVVGHLDDARVLVEDSHRRGAQAHGAVVPQIAEVELRLELVGRHDAHAKTAGNAALGLLTL